MKNWKLSAFVLLSSFLALPVCAIGQVAQSDLPDAPSRSSELYQPITGEQRFEWFVGSTIGPKSLITGVFTSAIATAENHPEEYGPQWEGFGKRYGIRLSGVATSSAMEASIGSLWGEDPRYFRAGDVATGERIKHIVVMTFAARHRDGNLAPAYARFVAIPASNFLSNTWRADSESTSGDALQRTGLGFLSKMGSNAFSEFWPDIKSHLFHKKTESGYPPAGAARP